MKRLFAGLLVILTLMMTAGCARAETVPHAVLIDAQAPQDVWTTSEVAGAEFTVMQKALGVKAPDFAYVERYMWRHQGMVEYRVIDSVLVLKMTLRPMYPSKQFAAQIAAHEFGHVLAIWYLDDYTEQTADVIAGCSGTQRLPAQEPGTCTVIRERLKAAAK